LSVCCSEHKIETKISSVKLVVKKKDYLVADKLVTSRIWGRTRARHYNDYV